MSWNIKTPGDYINGPLTVVGATTLNSTLTVSGVTQLNSNVGIGVAPSAWGTYKALQVTNASLWGAGNNTYVGANYYFDGANRKYIANGFASEYSQVSGAHAWFTAISGAAGVAFGFTQAMTLDASGRLIRGGATADTLTTDAATMVNLGNFAVQNAANTGTYIAIKPDVADQNVNIEVNARSGGVPDLRFLFGSIEKFRMTATGNLNLQSGQGINFGATGEAAGMTSETLADYEEGTWTPVLQGATTAGSYTFSYGVGKYTKIGRLVMVSASFVDVIQVTAGLGAIQVTGLPFNIPNDDPGSRGVVGELLIRQCNALPLAKNMYVQGSAGSTVVYFNYFDGSNDANINLSTIISGQTDFGFTLNYNV